VETIEKLSVMRVTGKGKRGIEEIVVTEAQLTIVVNKKRLITLPCSPNDLQFLAIGFLFSKGIIESKEEITKIELDDRKPIVWVETAKDNHVRSLSLSAVSHAANSKAQRIIESDISVKYGDIVSLMEKFQRRSEIFISTGGVHSVALCERKNILVFKEDISRNNALDKLFGECMLKDIPMKERMVITSCRISSEILRKVAKRNIPVLISRSAPTNLAVRLAAEVGITLIGFVRTRRMNVYANEWRVI
jgi:FdhD protein